MKEKYETNVKYQPSTKTNYSVSYWILWRATSLQFFPVSGKLRSSAGRVVFFPASQADLSFNKLVQVTSTDTVTNLSVNFLAGPGALEALGDSGRTRGVEAAGSGKAWTPEEPLWLGEAVSASASDGDVGVTVSENLYKIVSAEGFRSGTHLETRFWDLGLSSWIRSHNGLVNRIGDGICRNSGQVLGLEDQ